ncbi:hypothetical protein [Streptomyces sp. NPDC048508]|uniref:hypothetical protein n=1 Tax=Streptomyces sp. NPDC048508 TaxID=3365561 RepID=UPI0037104A6A
MSDSHVDLSNHSATLLFGEHFVRYVLALDEGEFAYSPSNSAQATGLAVMNEVSKATATEHPDVRSANLAVYLCRYVNDTAIANAIRKSCGGEFPPPDPETDDALLNSLLSVGRQLYPGFLISPPSPDPLNSHFACGAEISAHSSGKGLERKVLSDPDLSRLFPGSSHLLALSDRELIRELNSVTSLVTTSNIRGCLPLQVYSLGVHVLNGAFRRITLSGKPSMSRFLTEISRVLDEMRALARGEETHLPVAIGLGGLVVSEGISLSLGRAKLANREFCHRSQYHAFIQPTLTFNLPIKLLNVCKVEFTENGVTQPDVAKFQTEFDMWDKALDEIVTRASFSLLMASGDSCPSGGYPAFTGVLHPFFFHPTMYGGKQLTPVVKGIAIDQAYATQARAWASTVETSHPKNLNVALRRIVKAANGRLEPADILVDAVLAWENMFSGTPETNLRVCGSIAHILEPNDFDKRFELFRELKKIYAMRSNIVHGKSEPSLVQLHSAAESALETAFSSMRALYRIPELLSAKDAAERGSMTLLGIASTSKQQKEA